MTQLNLLDDHPSESMSWDGRRGAAVARLKTFVPRAGRAYAASRNYDRGPDNRSNISCLSPWIRHRVLLEEDVLQATLERHSLSTAEKFIQEVYWRAYFKGWLEQRPSVWTSYCSDVDSFLGALDRPAEFSDRYETAVGGRTGIDCFDAWTSELVRTGYLHNHARMWFASIWIFTLKLPWQLGADFFYRHLLDGDPASNTLSWRWVAGLHTKGRTYLARRSNIEKYTDGRFSPRGLAGEALPLVEDSHHPLAPIPQSAHWSGNTPFGLIITEEDCSPETLSLPGVPKGVCALQSTDARSPLEVGQPACQFATETLTDGAKRAETHFNCHTTYSDAKAWGPFLVDWARSLGVPTLVTAYVPVGPIRKKIAEALPLLEDAGIHLVEVRRAYDDASWPHATKGFFKLKAKIPALIKELGLS